MQARTRCSSGCQMQNQRPQGGPATRIIKDHWTYVEGCWATCGDDAGGVNAAGCHKGKCQEEDDCDVSASHCFVVESCTRATTVRLGRCLAPLPSEV